MLARVGLASILPKAEAPRSWSGETFTEFPRTCEPCSIAVRDMAVMAPGLLANRGIPKPDCPHSGDLPPLRKNVLLTLRMLTIRVLAIFTFRK